MKSKTIMFALLLCCSVTMEAQRQELSAARNTPREGDGFVKDRMKHIEPGESGENMRWNFGKLRLLDSVFVDHTVDYFTRSDRKIIGSENGTLSFLLLSGDSLMIYGYENPNALVSYHQPGLLMRFPLAYGTSSKSSFTGRGIHYDRFESVVSGEIVTVADAEGNLVLPGGEEFDKVIRVHIRKTEQTRYIPLTPEFAIYLPADESRFSAVEPEVIVTDTYQWYIEGYRYPVLETIERKRNFSEEKTMILGRETHFYHPEEQLAFLSEDSANREVRERKPAAKEESNIISFRRYPNPVKSQLDIELEFRSAVAVEAGVWSSQGVLVGRFPPSAGVTKYSGSLNVGFLLPGYYVVKVIAGDETVSETVLKN